MTFSHFLSKTLQLIPSAVPYLPVLAGSGRFPGRSMIDRVSGLHYAASWGTRVLHRFLACNSKLLQLTLK